MAVESVVTPLPEGSARHGDYHLLPLRSAAGGLANAGINRGGFGFDPVNGGNSNWGLLGTDLGTLVLYQGAPMYQLRGGCVLHPVRFPLIVQRPANITKWRDGLHVIEVVLAWPTNAVGADNGLIFGFVDNPANIRRSVSQCWTVENDTAGVIRVAVRGPVGTVFTNLAPAAAALTKVRVELRNATRDADGSVQIFVNDAGAPAFSQTTAEANFPAIGAGVNSLINIALGCGSATDYVHLTQWSVWRGPDTALGM